MRNAVVVILWGVAAATLIFLSPVQANLEAEIPPATEPSLADVQSVPDNSTTLSIILNQYSESDVVSQSNVVPQSDVVLLSDTVLNSVDEEEGDEHVDQEGEGEESFLERDLGNISRRSDRRKKKDDNSQDRKYKSNKGRENIDNSQNPKGLKKTKEVNAGAKRRQGQRRRPNDVRLKSRKKEKGKKTKPGQKLIRKKKIMIKEEGRVVRSKISGKNDTRPSEKNGESSLRKKSNNRKRCKPKKSCKKKDGKCRTSCKKKETEFRRGKCKGGCVCCLRKVKQCKQKGPCVGRGMCRNRCLGNETPASYLPCKGSRCICCISQSGQGVCTTSPECAKVRGTCKAACSGEKVAIGLCHGPHCSCCVPPVSCPNTASCKHSGGTCKSVCEDTEVRLPGSCNQGCFCCGPKPTECTQTPICPGKCAPMCLGVVSLEVHCLGDSCLCCLDCSPTQACTDAHGKCKSVCGCGEKELPNGCKGAGCKCCVANIPDCEMKQTGCNSCMYTPLCTGNPPAEFCKSGGPGCSCCPP